MILHFVRIDFTPWPMAVETVSSVVQGKAAAVVLAVGNATCCALIKQ
jgi:hypothetical protein